MTTPKPPREMNGEHGELWTRMWHLHQELSDLKSQVESNAAARAVEMRVGYALMIAILMAVITRWLV